MSLSVRAKAIFGGKKNGERVTRQPRRTLMPRLEDEAFLGL